MADAEAFTRIERKLTLLKCMVGVNIALNVLVLARVFTRL